MGTCWSNRIKAMSSPTGDNPNISSVDQDHSNIISSTLSSTFISVNPQSEDDILLSSNLKNFCFAELKTATGNFRLDTVVGEGGFGSVFQGYIDENSLTAVKPGTGTVVAVKMLNKERFQGHKEWLAEINHLGQLRHPNLVKLMGYCFEDDQRLLVYEYMSKRSLENHLFRTGLYFKALTWNTRMNIALGAARGLAFLHNTEMNIIYRDFKTSNILLDSDYNAKLSDFGLARDGPSGDRSYVSTQIMGTYGYTAPEYFATGHLTSKSNVYSFGVVFLEILSGRQAIDNNRPLGEHSLVQWAKPYLRRKRRINYIMDTRLEGKYQLGKAQKAANIALQCLAIRPKDRPTMDEVVAALEQLAEQNEDAIQSMIIEPRAVDKSV